MICLVIIYDFIIERKMSYVLDDTDFAIPQCHWDHGDPLLTSMQGNAIFDGKLRWCDLDLMHFHFLILNILKIMATMPDSQRSDKNNPAVVRLTFFLCSIILILQQRSQSLIELLRIKRLVVDDLSYDYSATLNVDLPASKALRIVIDNEV